MKMACSTFGQGVFSSGPQGLQYPSKLLSKAVVPNLLAPGANFMEDNFPRNRVVGDVFRMIQTLYIYCVLYIYYITLWCMRISHCWSDRRRSSDGNGSHREQLSVLTSCYVAQFLTGHGPSTRGWGPLIQVISRIEILTFPIFWNLCSLQYYFFIWGSILSCCISFKDSSIRTTEYKRESFTSFSII